MAPPPPPVPRVLLVAATTGYQIRMFGEAASRQGAGLVFATDRCHQLDDPWRDGAVPVRFHDEAASVRAIVDATADGPVDAVLAVGDRPAVIAARAARALGLPFHPPEAARIAANKLMTRVRLQEAGLPGPRFRSFPLGVDLATAGADITYPCVVKPLGLAASRGVMRANDAGEFAAAVSRLRRLLRTPQIRSRRDPADDLMLVEDFVTGAEVAVEGLVANGDLRVLALFEKPDPLDGPCFEESIYVTPPRLSRLDRQRVVHQIAAAVRAIGLTDGPIHAECRWNDREVVVLEVAARSIGGLCSKVLRFDGPGGGGSLEDLLIRHALSRPVADLSLAPGAAAVMMMPVPAAGVLRAVSGLEAARATPGVDDVVVTAKPGERLVPWPEGASYPGFIFARGEAPEAAVAALRTAHAALTFELDREIPVRTET